MLYVEIKASHCPKAKVQIDYDYRVKSGFTCMQFTYQILMQYCFKSHQIRISDVSIVKVKF